MIISVIFNGPPGSGKDTIAEQVNNMFVDSRLLAFKDKLYEVASSHFEVPFPAYKAICTDRYLKEQPMPFLDGRSPRESLIHVSEDIVKPSRGKNFFGKALAARLHSGVNLITDGGFFEELRPIIDRSDKTIIIRLFREGCDFSKDSRDYIEGIEGGNISIFNLENNGTIEHAVGSAYTMISTYLK